MSVLIQEVYSFDSVNSRLLSRRDIPENLFNFSTAQACHKPVNYKCVLRFSPMQYSLPENVFSGFNKAVKICIIFTRVAYPMFYFQI